jgi:galactokinase
MAEFAAKYLVSGATSGVRHTLGDVGKKFSQEEDIKKEDFDRIELELEKEEDIRRKKHAVTEAKRSKIRDQIRHKYGLDKSKRHEAAEILTGTQRTSNKTNERDFLLEQEEEDDDNGCCPSCIFCSCLPCFSNSSKVKRL